MLTHKVGEISPIFNNNRHNPYRRTRLPSHVFLGEILANPSHVLRAADPRRLRGLGTVQPDDRFIGLLMIRTENDVLPESLASMTRYFDRILVLDGTPKGPERDRCRDILSMHDEVVAVFADEDVGAPIRDGARQILLDEARSQFGVDNWIGILHGDEFHDNSPADLLRRHNPLLDPSIRVRVIHHFLHTDDAADWEERATLPVAERVRHYMWPGIPETRFFFDNGVRNYRLQQHSQVVPRGLRIGPLVDGYHIRQYNYRSPQQALDRATDRLSREWQEAHYAQMLDNAFVATLFDPENPDASYEHLDAAPPTVRRVGMSTDSPVDPFVDEQL